MRAPIPPRRHCELPLAKDNSLISRKLTIERCTKEAFLALSMCADVTSRVHDLACVKKPNISFGVIAVRCENVDKVLRRSDPSTMSGENFWLLRAVRRQR